METDNNFNQILAEAIDKEWRKKLKPCPFCGSPANLWQWNYGTAIECSKYNPNTHQVQIKQETREKAIEAWNRRVSDEKRHLY